MSKPQIIDGENIDIFEDLGVDYPIPSHDDIWRLLWGVEPGQPVPLKELKGIGVIGEKINE